MIDWIAFELSWHGPPIRDLHLIHRHKGRVERRCEGWVRQPGSYSSSLAVRAQEGRIQISGNPVKFLTGQNVVGTNDINLLARCAYRAALGITNGETCEIAEKELNTRRYRLQRVDCTEHMDVGSPEDVTNFLEHMEGHSMLKYRGRGHYRSDLGTIAWGMGEGKGSNGSRSSALKIYDKLKELEKRPLECNKEVALRLKNWASGKLRLEATYRERELKRLGYAYGHNWNLGSPKELLERFTDRLQISQMDVTKKDDAFNKLPRAQQSVYATWRAGYHMQDTLPRSSYYRHRKAILDILGVDISIRCEQKSPEKLRVVEFLKAETIPEPQAETIWAENAMKRFLADQAA